MRPAIGLVALAWCCAVMLAARPARAQSYDSEVRIDQYQPAQAGSPFTRAEGPREEFTEGIAYAFRVDGDYGYLPLRSRLEGGEPNEPGETSDKPLVEHAALLHVGAAISPLYWLSFGLAMPFAVFESGTGDFSVTQQQLSPGKMGVGDLRIGALATPYTSKVLDLILGARFWAPTGGRWAYLAGPDHSFRLEAVAAAAGEADLFLYGCTLGIAPLWFAGRDGDRLAASCAAGFKVHPVVSLGVEPHVAVFTYAPKGDDQLAPGLGAASFAVQFEPMGTASFHVADFHIGLAGGAGLGGAPGTATARAVLTLTYSAHGERVVEEEGEPDGDLDGIPDTYDACPKEAGPKSRRGCPEKRDADGDGIVEDDACPDAPGARYEDPKANGCPDRDNDHLADPVDPCPEEPGEETGGCPKFARFKGGDFVIDPPISFGANGAELSDDGRKALVEVIATLRANPKIEQVSVAIGSKGANNALTDRRAKALLTLFSDENIEQSRFEVVLDEKLANGKVTVRVLR